MEQLPISKRIALICNAVRRTNDASENTAAIVKHKKDHIRQLSSTYQVSEKTITNILQGL